MAKTGTKKKPDGVRGTGVNKKALESLAIDPLVGMSDLALHGESEAVRAKLLMELAQYVYLKKKDVGPETSAETEDEDETSYEEKLERAQDE